MEALLADFEKKLKLKDKGVGEYSIEHLLALAQLSLSPQLYGRPSTSQQQISKPQTIYNGTFIREAKTL